MLAKATALGLILSTPLLIAANQDPACPRPNGGGAAAAPRSHDPGSAPALELQRLRDQVAALRGEVARAKQHCQELTGQIEECLDMLDQATAPAPRHNCSPSRGSQRALMTQLQWLQRHGYSSRSEKTLARLAEAIGDQPDRLNDVAWRLMTEAETAGKLDDVALALARRMQKARGDHMPHQYLDTLALAVFLNGQRQEAVALQQRAVRADQNNDEYRRRLRTYEAALAAAAPKALSVAAAAPAADDSAGATLHEE